MTRGGLFAPTNLAKRCFETAESSEFIEHAVHGVLHGNYDAGEKETTELECFEYKDGNNFLTTQSEEEIAHRQYY